MSKLVKNLTLRVPFQKRCVVAQLPGEIPALKAVTQEVGALQVTVEATKCLGVSRLEPLHERYDVEIVYVFHNHTEVRELLEATGYLDTLHEKLLPLVAEEFEGKREEVAA